MKKGIIALPIVAIALALVAGCSKNQASSPSESQTYVLVHGAWQAPYVWNQVRDKLEDNGHKVVVVELPGHGSDQTPAHSITLDLYRDRVIDAISEVNNKVILVGHSMAGMVISHVAEKVPTKINQLVYIGAFLPISGQSISDISPTDPASQLGKALVPSPDGLLLDVEPKSLTELFIKDGSASAKQSVIDNYRPEPAIPFGDKVILTPANFGSVPKIFIKTLKDIVISPILQDRMISGAGIDVVYPVNASHSPFLSLPLALTDILLEIGQTYATNQARMPFAVHTEYVIPQNDKQQTFNSVRKYIKNANADVSNVMAEAYYEEDKSAIWIIERWVNKKAFDFFREQNELTKKVSNLISLKDLEPISKEQWRKSGSTNDQEFTIMLFVDSKSGTEDNFKNIYHSAMPEFRAEPGVLNYQLSQFQDDKTKFVTYEKFKNEEAFQYHLNFPPIKPVLDFLTTSIKQTPFQEGLHRLIPIK